MANTTITNQVNVDFFKADKELSIRVPEFFRCILAKAEINKKYKAETEVLEGQIALYKDIIKNGSQTLTKDEAIDNMVKFEEKLAKLNEEKSALIKEQAKFEYTKADKDFRNACNSAKNLDEVRKAVRDWFFVYGLTIHDTIFESNVMEAIGQKVSVNALCESNGENPLSWSGSDCLKSLYGSAFKDMVPTGIIKPATIPELVRADYVKKQDKKAKKLAKKQAKKAQKVA